MGGIKKIGGIFWVSVSVNPESITRLTALFVTRHPISLEFRDWLKDTLIPDESFYATLSRVRGLDPETELVVMDTKTKTLHNYCVRISHWKLQNITCAGKKKNHIIAQKVSIVVNL